MERQTSSNKELKPRKKTSLIINFQNELKKNSLKKLKNLEKQLNFICLKVDPYQQNELGEEEKNILLDLKIQVYLSNPFEFTNIILQMLDLIETEINKRKN